jgi:hypothetical protein
MNAGHLEELKLVAGALRTHYKERYHRLIALEQKAADQLELLLLLNGEVNPMREILRVEPVARRFSTALFELSILPISREAFTAALEPELWEAHFTGTVVDAAPGF